MSSTFEGFTCHPKWDDHQDVGDELQKDHDAALHKVPPPPPLQLVEISPAGAPLSIVVRHIHNEGDVLELAADARLLELLVHGHLDKQSKANLDGQAKHEVSKGHPEADPRVLVVVAARIRIFAHLVRFPVGKHVKEAEEGDEEGNDADSPRCVGNQSSEGKEDLGLKGEELDLLFCLDFDVCPDCGLDGN